jgi:N-acyl-L-homoserine lactone synthetase
LGFVGVFDLEDETIGTIRIVPLGYQLTLTEMLLPQLGESAPALSPHDWEVGRLVLAPQFRSDVEALRHCLHLSLSFARANAPVDCLFANCTHVLARLYRRFGFAPFARDVKLPGTDKTYTLIHGCAAEVEMALAGKSVSSARSQ